MNNQKHNDKRDKQNSTDKGFRRQDPDAEVMDDVQQASDQTQEQEFEVELESAENEVDTLRADLEKQKESYLYLMAEFDNFRKRTVKEKAEMVKTASSKVLEGLLPIVDDFERGLEANRGTNDSEALKQGMELIYNKLIAYMERHGVKAIESTGKDFDPDLHEAIAMIPASDDSQKGKVIDTPTKGYTLNDKVLRHAKVVVAQ